MKISLIVEKRPISGEGPLCDERVNRLFWLDISKQELNSFDPETNQNEVFKLPERVSCIGPYGEKDFVAATRHGASRLFGENSVL